MEIKKNIQINNNPSAVFDAISKGILFKVTGILESSFSFNFVEEGEYAFAWPKAGKCRGRFINITPHENILFTWIKTEASYSQEPMETRVEITLKQTLVGTDLTLVHSGFKIAEAYRSHDEGWDSVLKEFSKSIV